MTNTKTAKRRARWTLHTHMRWTMFCDFWLSVGALEIESAKRRVKAAGHRETMRELAA